MILTRTRNVMMMMLIKSFSVNILIMVYCCSILFRGICVECVRINKVSPTQFIESGSSQSVILDCHYEIDEVHDKMLVLKWFHKNDPTPIYQWIVAKNRIEFSDKIEPFVDKNYSVKDKLTRFRAIRLINPPSSLSGQYTCSVSSLHGHESKRTELIIYEKAKSFNIEAAKVDNGINITCNATGIFPEPQLTLYKIKSNDSNNPIEITERTTSIREQSGHYFISLESKIYENSTSTLDVADHYECTLAVPNTDYSESKTLALQAGWNPKQATSNSNFTASSLVSLVLPLLAVVNIIYSNIA